MKPKLLLADDSITIQKVVELIFSNENSRSSRNNGPTPSRKRRPSGPTSSWPISTCPSWMDTSFARR